MADNGRVAVTRKRVAYWIGLALLAVPTPYVVVGYALDRVDRHGESLRDLVTQKLAWYRTYPPKPPAPPSLLTLEARLR